MNSFNLTLSEKHFIFPSTLPPYSSCPCVILISSLASTFPTLFLPSPYLFSTYHLCYFFSVPFLPISSSHSPVDNPPCDLHFCGSVPVLVCLVCFCFCFRCSILITVSLLSFLLFTFFIFFFLDKSL